MWLKFFFYWNRAILIPELLYFKSDIGNKSISLLVPTFLYFKFDSDSALHIDVTISYVQQMLPNVITCIKLKLLELNSINLYFNEGTRVKVEATKTNGGKDKSVLKAP